MALPIELTRRRFTAEEFVQVAETGIFAGNDRVELIEGEIVQMTPTGHRHGATVAALTHFLVTALGTRAVFWSQSSFLLSGVTMPQPDVLLLRPPLASYRERHPGADDVLLVVEIADTSHRHDRQVKLPLYARAGLPETWIVDIPGEAIEVYRRPTPAGYEQSERVGRSGVVAPEAFPDIILSVEAILGLLPE